MSKYSDRERAEAEAERRAKEKARDLEIKQAREAKERAIEEACAETE